MDAITVDHLSKHFRIFRGREDTIKGAFARAFRSRVHPEQFWALREVSFSVGRGETYGIIGGNGSGKSTMLKILCGILKPDRGIIQVRGKLAALLELGAGFHPDLTGRENVYLNGSLLGFSKSQIDRRFDAIVSFSELNDFIDTPLKHYSSGMYVRLGFAIAVNVDPEILLIDEVIAVGDERFQQKCFEKMNEFKRTGKTIILVSHSLEAVRNLCLKALWLKEGRLQAEGPVDGVINAYLSSVASQESRRLQEVQRTAPVTSASSVNRWGTREIEITGVLFYDRNGEEQAAFRTGDPLRARIFYRAKQRITSPVFGIAIHRDDGTHVTGPNTKVSRQLVESLEGEGDVDYVMSELLLLPGKYFLSAAVYDYECQHAYDHHSQMYPFIVVAGDLGERLGICHLPAAWEYHRS
jgi:lipopolysaccharide transport system ATP-binding protein